MGTEGARGTMGTEGARGTMGTEGARGTMGTEGARGTMGALTIVVAGTAVRASFCHTCRPCR